MPDLVNGLYSVKNPEWLIKGQPFPVVAGVQGGSRSNLLASQLTVDNAAFTTGQINYVGIPLLAGDVVNRVSFRVGATAGATLTQFFGALYDPTGVRLAQSTSQQLTLVTSGIPANTTGVTAMTANVSHHLILGSQTVPTPIVAAVNGIYYVAICITGTTIPSLIGTALATASTQGEVLGTVAASRTSVSPSSLLLTPNSTAGVAGSYYFDAPVSMLDASTATTTAPALMTTNGALTKTAKVPAVWVS